jgi:hypothetical protein
MGYLMNDLRHGIKLTVLNHSVTFTEFAAAGGNLPVIHRTTTYRQDRALAASFAFSQLAHDTHHR